MNKYGEELRDNVLRRYEISFRNKVQTKLNKRTNERKRKKEEHRIHNRVRRSMFDERETMTEENYSCSRNVTSSLIKQQTATCTFIQFFRWHRQVSPRLLSFFSSSPSVFDERKMYFASGIRILFMLFFFRVYLLVLRKWTCTSIALWISCVTQSNVSSTRIKQRQNDFYEKVTI